MHMPYRVAGESFGSFAEAKARAETLSRARNGAIVRVYLIVHPTFGPVGRELIAFYDGAWWNSHCERLEDS